ncbi:MAG: hypothetical protein V1733_01865 [bacterium]
MKIILYHIISIGSWGIDGIYPIPLAPFRRVYPIPPTPFPNKGRGRRNPLPPDSYRDWGGVGEG